MRSLILIALSFVVPALLHAREVPEFKFSQNSLLVQMSKRPGFMGFDTLKGSAENPVVVNFVIELANHILFVYPPEKYNYVSVGRSGAGLALALEARLSEMKSTARVVELPISGLSQRGFRAEWYSAPLERHLHHHLGELQTDHRHLLFLDFVSSGRSLGSQLDILQMAREKHWIKSSIRFLGLLSEHKKTDELRLDLDKKSWASQFPAERLHFLKLSEAATDLFFSSAFKEYSKYGTWGFRYSPFEDRMRANEGKKIPDYLIPKLPEIPEAHLAKDPSLRLKLKQLLKAEMQLEDCARHFKSE